MQRSDAGPLLTFWRWLTDPKKPPAPMTEPSETYAPVRTESDFQSLFGKHVTRPAETATGTPLSLGDMKMSDKPPEPWKKTPPIK